MKHKNTDGFSLIELCVILVIAGLLSAFAITAFFSASQQTPREKTLYSIDRINAAIVEFKFRKKRYPCPASLTASPQDADYGVEKCTPPATGVTSVNGRDADNNGAPDKVLIGAVPYKTLLCNNNQESCADIDRILLDSDIRVVDTLDGWDNRITYAVSEKLTNAVSYNDRFGAISVVDEFGENILAQDGSAHMALISHGKNGKGGYRAKGDQVSPCGVSSIVLPGPGAPPLPAGSIRKDETENCDQSDARFLSGLAIGNPAYYNDDIVDFTIRSSDTLWLYTRTSTGQDGIRNLNTGYVGIGTDTPQEQLHINGSLLTSDRIMADRICDTNGENCMPVSTLTGNLPAMDCRTSPGHDDYVVTSIQNNSVDCVRARFSLTEQTCPAGQVMTGLQTDGTTTSIVCRACTGCP